MSTTGGTPMGPTAQLPREKVAMRAYEKWLKRGCTHGNDVQDWIEAEAEVRAEMQRSGTYAGTRR
jgi:hypothetical protein